MPKLEPSSRGVLFGFAAYGMWGLFPLYFDLLADASAWEIVAHRIVWTMLLAAVGIAVVRQWDNLRAVLANRKVLGTLAAAGVLVTLNWTIYVWAVVNGRVVDAALGYFINPLVTVTLAIVVLRERLRPVQLVALGISVVAVVILVVGYGEAPWVALGLAVSFGSYSLAKNRVGPYVKPLVGLGVETTVVAPAALAFIVWAQTTGVGTLTSHGSLHLWLLVASGAVTAIPLLAFAAAASRIPLSMLGMLQYLTPTLHFLIGVFLNHEEMPPARWIGFGLVWCALVALTWDSIHAARGRREQARLGP